MAGDHEMISAIALVPERVLVRNDVYIVVKDPVEAGSVEVSGRGNGFVDVVDNVGDGEGQEEGMSLLRPVSPKAAAWSAHHVSKLIDELSFDSVDIVHRSIVNQWLLSFFVRPYLKSFHHFYVTPVFSSIYYFCGVSFTFKTINLVSLL